MRERLSTGYYIGRGLVYAFILFVLLSVPPPHGTFKFILIPSHWEWFTVFQRIIHYGICFIIIKYFERAHNHVEFDESIMYLVDSKHLIVNHIPLERITRIELTSRSHQGANPSTTFEVFYLDGDGYGDVFTFKALHDKKLKRFIKFIEAKNPDFEFVNKDVAH
ncbi:hypothetical protein C3K47_01385 [Solitalea longa]|uniref:Uncharacterized protein n=1 Tax=Solitalea longa TaxID=2079460 RepID=A0A2S5A9H8_9SPHI|nr:hypothetical protein [Solitalea longa]POY39176.1 hypothetical protein C3K47_01385 [Solitalea longa]